MASAAATYLATSDISSHVVERNAPISGFRDARFERKPTSKQKFYCVRIGRKPGIYHDWSECSAQVKCYRGAKYKAFTTLPEAEHYLKGEDIPEACSQSNNARDSSLRQPGSTPCADSEDGFDSNVTLGAETGNIVTKSRSQRAATKVQAEGLIDSGMLIVHTDGSSLGNGTGKSSAGVGIFFGPGDSRNVSEPLRGQKITNQRAEVTAIARAIEIVPKDCSLTVITDSQYAMNCVTKWYESWQKNGWRNCNGKDVEHKEIIEGILSNISERERFGVETHIKWTKGHAGDLGNIGADDLAINGARIAKATSASIP